MVLRATLLALTAALVMLPAAAAAQSARSPSAARPAVDSGVVERTELFATTPDPTVETTGGSVVVTKLDPASVLYKLGIRAGDTVLAVNGDLTTTVTDLTRQAVYARIRSVMYVEVLRRRKPLLLRRVITGDIAPSDPTKLTPDDVAFAAQLERMIVQKDPTTWQVDIDSLLADPMRISKGARVVPSAKDGKPNGFKLYAVRPRSVYARLGFENGDNITHINGYSVASIDVALEVYTKVRNADKIEVNIIRRGKPVTQTYLRMKTKAP